MRRHPARGWRRAVPALALSLALILLGGCEIEPLYGTRSGVGAASAASAIEIEPVKDRIGHIVRNHLIDSLSPDGPPVRPDYRLTLSVTQDKKRLLIQRDDRATRFNLTLRATFSLVDSSGEEVYSGSARATGSFNVSESGYANLIGERDAADEAARVLSQEIRTLVLLNLPQ